MRKHILAVAIMLGMVSTLSFASEPKKVAKDSIKIELNGKTFRAVPGEKKTQESAKKTDYIWEDSKRNTYPIWISKNGKAFIKKVSKKTGNEYNYYLPEEVNNKLNK